MKKRLLSFLLVLVMVLGIVPFSAFSAFAADVSSAAKSSDVETVTVTTFDGLREALEASGEKNIVLGNDISIRDPEFDIYFFDEHSGTPKEELPSGASRYNSYYADSTKDFEAWVANLFDIDVFGTKTLDLNGHNIFAYLKGIEYKYVNRNGDIKVGGIDIYNATLFDISKDATLNIDDTSSGTPGNIFFDAYMFDTVGEGIAAEWHYKKEVTRNIFEVNGTLNVFNGVIEAGRSKEQWIYDGVKNPNRFTINGYSVGYGDGVNTISHASTSMAGGTIFDNVFNGYARQQIWGSAVIVKGSGTFNSYGGTYYGRGCGMVNPNYGRFNYSSDGVNQRFYDRDAYEYAAEGHDGSWQWGIDEVVDMKAGATANIYGGYFEGMGGANVFAGDVTGVRVFDGEFKNSTVDLIRCPDAEATNDVVELMGVGYLFIERYTPVVVDGELGKIGLYENNYDLNSAGSVIAISDESYPVMDEGETTKTMYMNLNSEYTFSLKGEMKLPKAMEEMGYTVVKKMVVRKGNSDVKSSTSQADISFSYTFTEAGNYKVVQTLFLKKDGKEVARNYYTFNIIAQDSIPDFATGLVIEKMPNKTTYKVGEDFDPTGMKIVANYSNQPAQDVTSEIIYVNNSNKNFDIYTQSVTVKYRYGNGMWKSLSIPVKMEHYYIEEAQIINLIPPVAGKNPDYDINDFTRFCDIANRQRDCWGYGWDNNGFAWYDEDGKMMGPTAVFEEGKEYTLKIMLDADRGAGFSVSKGLNVTINTDKLSKDAVSFVGNKAQITVKYVALKNTDPILISNYEIFGIETPVEGRLPDQNGEVGDPALYDIHTDNTSSGLVQYIHWYEVDEDGYGYEIFPEDGEIFEAGKVYRVEIKIARKQSADGSVIVTDYDPNATAVIFGETLQPITFDEMFFEGKNGVLADTKNQTAYIQYTFEACAEGDGVDIKGSIGSNSTSPAATPVSYVMGRSATPVNNTVSGVEGVTVELVPLGMDTPAFTTTTNADGSYSFINVDRQYYTIRIAHEDYDPVEEQIELDETSGDMDACNFALARHICADNAVKVEATPFSCTTWGNGEYYECSCGKVYSDAACTDEHPTADAFALPPSGHVYNQSVEDAKYLRAEATCQAPTSYWKSCEMCQASAANADDADSNADLYFEVGTTVEHDYDEVVHPDAVVAGTGATCLDKVHYYKLCKVCGTKSADSFESNMVGPHGEISESPEYKTEEGHAYVCTVCNEPSLLIGHTYGEDTTCDDCGYVHTHAFADVYSVDENNHWYECTCGAKKEEAAHADGDADFKCDACGMAVVPPEHVCDFGTELKHDSENHWYECACGEKSDVAAHTPNADDGDCTTEITCSVCGTVTTAANAAHTAGTDDGDCTTAVKCVDCDKIAIEAKAAHADTDTNGKCDACGKDMPTTPGGDEPGTDTPGTDDPNTGNTDEPKDDEDGLGTGAIVAIVVGSVLVVGVGIFALFWFVIKKKSFADLIAVFKKKK